MKKKTLELLLSEAIVAMIVLGINKGKLAQILGVSVKTVRKWFDFICAPSELNKYKLNWFVYLVNELNTPLDILLESYDLASMNLDCDPVGNRFHIEPWNGETYEFKTNNYTGLTIEPMDHVGNFSDTFAKYDSLNSKIGSSIVMANDFDDLAKLLSNHDNKDALKDEYDIRNVLRDGLSLRGLSYQESIRRVGFLKKLCDIFIDLTEEFMDINLDGVMESYVKVHSFGSFVKFIKAFDTASYVDERFDMDHVNISFSHYTDPSHKTVNTKKVRSITVYKSYFEIKCADDSTCRINNDERFVINSSGGHKTDNFSFLMRVASDYYALSFELG